MTDELIWVPAGASDDVPDTRTLGELEGVIRRGLQTFMEVGKALQVIRNRRLYKEKGFERFEDYCKEEWGWGSSRARQITGAAKVVEEMWTVTNVTLPETEAQVRPLARVEDPKERAEVWSEVSEEARIESKPVTAAKVEERVNQRLGKPKPTPEPEKPKSSEPKEPTVGESLGDQSAEALDLPPFHLPEERRVYKKIILNLKDIAKLDNERIVALCKGPEEADREIEYLNELMEEFSDLRARFQARKREWSNLRAVK